MCKIPVIDLSATGQNIARLRIAAGLSVKDLQDIFGFANPQAIYKWMRSLYIGRPARSSMLQTIISATVF